MATVKPELPGKGDTSTTGGASWKAWGRSTWSLEERPKSDGCEAYDCTDPFYTGSFMIPNFGLRAHSEKG